MDDSHSDALVFFGATGDLAYKKIFPSLQAMVKRGHLGVSEILVRLYLPPTMYQHYDLKPNYCRLRISPDIVLAFGFNVTSPVHESQSELTELIASRHPCAKEMDAYERVLGDAMAGDATLFAREDYVEEAWRIVDPVLKAGTPLKEYEPNTWGPRDVEQLTPPGGWQNPVVNP